MNWHFEDFIYGSFDGTVTTFAIVAGSFGASLSPEIILILGFANLFADGFAMAIGSFQATKAREEFIQKERKREEWEIENMRESEKKEIEEIYSKKGFKGKILDDIVDVITRRRKVWLDTMMREELGLIEDSKKPINAAVSTFVGFNLIGLIPLLPFAIFLIDSNNIDNAILYSVSFTAGAFFLIGIIKGRFVKHNLIKSGLYSLFVGSIAASIAYFVGFILNELI